MEYLIIKGDTIVIQAAPYIEDGPYIEIIGSEITLYEIPLFGGEPYEVGKFDTLLEAIKRSEELT